MNGDALLWYALVAVMMLALVMSGQDRPGGDIPACVVIAGLWPIVVAVAVASAAIQIVSAALRWSWRQAR